MLQLFPGGKQIQRVRYGEEVKRPTLVRALIPIRFLDVDSLLRHFANSFCSCHSFLLLSVALSCSLSLSHTCSVSSPRYTHPHHATGFFASCSLDSKTTRGRFHTNPRERTLTRLRRIASRDWIEPLHNAISSPPSPPCSTFRSRYFSLSVLLSASHPFDAVIDNACTPARPPPCHRRFSLPPPPTDGDTFIDGQFAVWDFILFFFFLECWSFIKIVKDFF